ncbi:chromosome segregation protein [Angulomicrobium tetraedrale]|uniref:Chromosome partition protein Smc n=1 Tax=Ancylobacter tetraedralis TaxID=217068 RepID=A0A839ZEU4_9HYPH|nr:AAA family ATPase [Ancylobacter tetraedralis]MBB3773176.1 chromosome segregation protein [Ancylobacter tetraedralis]
MKFTRLRLTGFKTFVEPTDMLIEPGLTGIVGPNGCGKSNLVEALRWVMGENSYKAMRAEGMDDVIFGGTTTRASRNTAEVVLVVDNGDRSAPAVFNDADLLEISRRIERESGSAYRINGREARARDVQMLFADASSGSRSPSMVRQGQIGEIVGAKPTARRRLLEEAAGVAGLHARRHEAEMRLRAAEANLTRLDDVIGQIASQLDALRRQARQAARYRAVSTDIRTAEATLLWLRWLEASGALNEASRALDLAVRSVAERTVQQGESARLAAIAAHGLPALREADAASAAALQRLTLAQGELDREEARADARRAELDRRLSQLAGDMERERALAADAGSVLGRLAEEAEELAALQEEAAEAEGEAGEAREDAAQALAESERAFTEATASHAERAARRGALERSVREAGERHARLERDVAQLTEERRRLEAGVDGVRLEERRASAEITREAFEAAEASAQEAEAAHGEARAALDHARRPLAEAERVAQRLDTEARTLAKLLDVGAPRRWAPVIDQIRVARGFETALGAALGDDLDAPADVGAPVHWALTPDDGDAPLPSGAEPLARHVEAPAELARRLAQIGVVERSEGARLAAQLRPGQRLVSREGDLWRWDGLTAAADAPTAAARRLAERNRLADIEAERIAARAEVAQHRRALESAEAALRAAGSRENAAREARRAALRAMEATRDDLARAERQAAEQEAKLSALAASLDRLDAERVASAAGLMGAQAQLAELPAGMESEAHLVEARSRVAQDRAALAEARARAEGLTREREQRVRRLQAIAGERASWQARASGTGERVAALEARVAEAAEEREALDEVPAALAARRRALLDEIARAEAARRESADRLASGEGAQVGAERAARAALDALAVAREESARGEARLDAARERREQVLREISDSLDGPPDSARTIAGLEADTPLPDAAGLEADLDRLKRERERLGAVNLRAEEELAEVEGQQQGLSAEREDLTEAIKRLRQGIYGLNREARERLQASFTVVDGHFQQLFGTLFGGGEARLVLTDSDDPLEAGLDIIAKPPGKKPQSLSLLSGGEQALTAMALIFAVFLTNPAPICVLDEVDAPLDDSNVERFCNLLDEMRRLTETRFITITHNPITMSRMNRLFGVTMAERGVSKLVSVDLATAETYREAS